MKTPRIVATAAALLTVTAMSVALTACGRDASPTATSHKTTEFSTAKATGTVSMWMLGGDSGLQGFVKTFEDANPGVTVNVTEVPWDSAYTKLQTAIAAGNTPDIAAIPGNWNPNFAYAFDTVPSGLDTSRYISGALKTNEVDGRLTGVPWAIDIPVLYYRTDLAKKAGWDHAPITWDELKQLASDYKTKAGTTWGMRFPAGGEGSFAGISWLPISNGAQMLKGDKWSFDTPAWTKAYDYWLSFYKAGLSDPTAVNDLPTGLSDFVSGTSPMLVTGPWMVGQLKTTAGADFSSKYATALLPKAPGQKNSVSVMSTTNLVVFKNSKNKAAAWKLADWLSQPKEQGARYQYSGALPADTAAWDLPILKDDAKFSVFGTQAKTSSFFPVVTTLTQIAAIGDKLVEPLARGTMTVPDALESLQTQANKVGVKSQ